MTDHKGHNICDMIESQQVQMFQRRAQILKKKIDASSGETEIFADELNEIEDQLAVSETQSDCLTNHSIDRAPKRAPFPSWKKSLKF